MLTLIDAYIEIVGELQVQLKKSANEKDAHRTHYISSLIIRYEDLHDQLVKPDAHDKV